MRANDTWLRWLLVSSLPFAAVVACGEEFQSDDDTQAEDGGTKGLEPTPGKGGSTGRGGDGSGAGAGEDPGSAGDGGGGASGGSGTSGATGMGGDGGASQTGGVGGSMGATAGAATQGGAGAGGSAGARAGGPNVGGSGGTGVVDALYFEDFEDGVADGWNQNNMTTGTWSVFVDGANHVYRQGLQPTGVVWVIHATPTWADLRVQARVRFNTEFEAGDGRLHLGARYTSLDSYYRATLRLNGSASVARNGTDVVLNEQVAVSVGGWHTLALSLVGNVVTLEYDGTVLGSATDTGPLVPAGGIALGIDHATVDVDDIVVTAP